MLKVILFMSGIGILSSAIALPASAGVSVQSNAKPVSSSFLVADLFDVIRVVEDVDDLAKGNIGGLRPVKKINRELERGLDDVNDTLEDVGKDIRRSTRDLDREIDNIADDMNDWFN